MNTQDALQAFQINHGEYRGVLVHLEKTYHEIAQMHHYPLIIQCLLGQALAAVSLLGHNLKQEGKLALQFSSAQETLKLLLVEINQQLDIRGLIQWQAENIFTNENILPEGQIALTLTPLHGERYQGIVPTVAGSLAKSLESYFSQSEQIFTRILLVANEHTAAGLLLQKMPEKESAMLELTPDVINFLLATVKKEELLNDSNEVFLRKFFHEHDVELFQTNAINFKCSCTVEKMSNAVRLLGEEEAESILSTHQYIEVTCDFCNRHYQFERAEVRKIFAEVK